MTKEGQKTGMVCIYYDKIVRGGGINRFNGHLAGEKGQVEICKKVPAKVCYKMKQNLDGNKSQRRKNEERDNSYPPSEIRVMKCQ